MSVRVRYAPSPTGSPHVGNIRTALFDHLFARRCNGVNILRIEDTDRARLVPGCEEEIQESLRWMGIEWQEGHGVGGPHAPYRQSERAAMGIYNTWIEKLLAIGAAYRAFDTPRELEEMREYQTINKQPVGYFGGVWRDASDSQVGSAIAEGKPSVVRQRMPRGKTVVVQDHIRGRIEFDSDTVDDPVLIKADGMPTYHFAAMVDDHLMEITHIVRGEEWISSAPKHAALFESFGWTPPTFVHVPVIKGKDGSKLSKRHGDTACLDFKWAGYLPEAMANFIALIGWSPGGDRELLNPQELVEAFSLDGLQPSPGVFDLEKLRWMNGHYLRGLPVEELVSRVSEYVSWPEVNTYWLDEKRAETGNAVVLADLGQALKRSPDLTENALHLEQERVSDLAEFGAACHFFFVDQPDLDPKATEKWFKEEHVAALFESLKAWLDGRELVTTEECEAFCRDFQAEHGLEKLGPVVHPTRVALTGQTVGPGLFELMAALGPQRMIARIERALGFLQTV